MYTETQKGYLQLRILITKITIELNLEIKKFGNYLTSKVFIKEEVKKIIYKIEAIEEKTRNIIKTRIQKDKQSKKLFQGNRNQCKARKMKKLIVLNYTERGKKDKKRYNYLYTISILYTYTLPTKKFFFTFYL